MQFSDSIFAVRFGITRQDLENYLGEALSQGGDYADLYFEYLATSTIGIDESMVKSAAQGVSMGVGVRVISGERRARASIGASDPQALRPLHELRQEHRPGRGCRNPYQRDDHDLRSPIAILGPPDWHQHPL